MNLRRLTTAQLGELGHQAGEFAVRQQMIDSAYKGFDHVRDAFVYNIAYTFEVLELMNPGHPTTKRIEIYSATVSVMMGDDGELKPWWDNVHEHPTIEQALETL